MIKFVLSIFNVIQKNMTFDSDSWFYFKTDSEGFLKALFKIHRIQNCVVTLQRLNEEDIHKAPPKLRLTPMGTVRTNSSISWFPSASDIREHSVDARSSLAVFQNENDVVQPVVGRSKYICFFSHFVCRTLTIEQ